MPILIFPTYMGLAKTWSNATQTHYFNFLTSAICKKIIKSFISVPLLNLGLLGVNTDFFNLKNKTYIWKFYDAKCKVQGVIWDII